MPLQKSHRPYLDIQRSPLGPNDPLRHYLPQSNGTYPFTYYKSLHPHSIISFPTHHASDKVGCCPEKLRSKISVLCLYGTRGLLADADYRGSLSETHPGLGSLHTTAVPILRLADGERHVELPAPGQNSWILCGH